ncbi:hypothetical protein R1sor_022127 [Riccia sorocarpa]|uniref:Uncharacterized protein n=1 Tax=Riccia sorocarpa TaxID=122646 RepID=A0ABD3GKP7_9MARC
MDESSGSFSGGSLDGLTSVVGQFHLGGEAGGRGDPRSRGASHRGSYRRGGFTQRGRNFQNVTRQGRGNGEFAGSLPDSQRNDEFSASGMSGPSRLTANSSREVLGFPRDNSQDVRRTNAGRDGSFHGDGLFTPAAAFPPPADDYRNSQNDYNPEYQSYHGNPQQQRVGYEANRFGGPRRGGGRGQRFSERPPSDVPHTPPQTGRRGGRIHHNAEDGRRVDGGREDENRRVEFPGGGVYRGVDQGTTAAQLDYSEYAGSESGSTTSSDYRRESRFIRDAGFESRSGSSHNNVPSGNFVNIYDGADNDRGPIRENHRGSNGSGGQRRDSQQAPGRRGPQTESGGPLWRAKKSQVPQLVQELEERLSKGSIECMICYDMWRPQRLVLVARRHSLADVASKRLSAAAGTFVGGRLTAGGIHAREYVMKGLVKLARPR